MRAPAQILAKARSIAIVGASPHPGRPSHGVMRYVLEQATASFRCAHLGATRSADAGALWLQLGIRSPEARWIAEEAELDYVEDACTAVVHGRRARA